MSIQGVGSVLIWSLSFPLLYVVCLNLFETVGKSTRERNGERRKSMYNEAVYIKRDNLKEE